MFNDKRRCEILGIKNPEYDGGCCNFRNLNLDGLKELISEGYIDLEECQNESPTTEEFKNFMESNSNIELTAHGYVISPERDDCRVTIEGIEYIGNVNKEMQLRFIKEFRFADECIVSDSKLYCWYN